jgi:putative transposase
MKKARFAESQIISILSKQEKGITVADICREHGICHATLFNWKGKYAGMSPSQLRNFKELDRHN